MRDKCDRVHESALEKAKHHIKLVIGHNHLVSARQAHVGGMWLPLV